MIFISTFSSFIKCAVYTLMEDYCSMAVSFLESELNSYKTFIDKSVDLNKREILCVVSLPRCWNVPVSVVLSVEFPPRTRVNNYTNPFCRLIKLLKMNAFNPFTRKYGNGYDSALS